MEQHDAMEKLLTDLHNGDIPIDYTLGQNYAALNCISSKDLSKLYGAWVKLFLKSNDKSLDVFL